MAIETLNEALEQLKPGDLVQDANGQLLRVQPAASERGLLLESAVNDTAEMAEFPLTLVSEMGKEAD